MSVLYEDKSSNENNNSSNHGDLQGDLHGDSRTSIVKSPWDTWAPWWDEAKQTQSRTAMRCLRVSTWTANCFHFAQFWCWTKRSLHFEWAQVWQNDQTIFQKVSQLPVAFTSRWLWQSSGSGAETQGHHVDRCLQTQSLRHEVFNSQCVWLWSGKCCPTQLSLGHEKDCKQGLFSSHIQAFVNTNLSNKFSIEYEALWSFVTFCVKVPSKICISHFINWLRTLCMDFSKDPREAVGSSAKKSFAFEGELRHSKLLKFINV